ncbi:unnamed protein product [Ascophyllum nodosum]
MRFCGALLSVVSCSSLWHRALSFFPSASTRPGHGEINFRGTLGGGQRRTRPQYALHASSSSNWFAQLLTKPAATSERKSPEVKKLKQQLLETVRGTQRGVSTTEGQRKVIDALIAALEPLNPNADAVKSESLSALWILEWTTEREILFLMENGLPGQPSGPVKQEIDVDAKTLSNIMVFGKDSLFEVASTINPEESGPRVNFEFKACKFKYGGIQVPLPPVGKGWFESVYLDEDLRVTRDIRGDVSVLVKSKN